MLVYVTFFGGFFVLLVSVWMIMGLNIEIPYLNTLACYNKFKEMKINCVGCFVNMQILRKGVNMQIL